MRPAWFYDLSIAYVLLAGGMARRLGRMRLELCGAGHRPCGRSAHRSCWLKNIQVGPRALLSYYCLCWIIKCPSHGAMVADWRPTARRL